MNPGNENKLSISVSLQKQRSSTQGIKSDSIPHRTGSSLVLTKTHSKPRQSKSQRKENLSRNLSAEKSVPPEVVESNGKRLFVVRHGERVDFTFGSSWIQRCFDAQGNYCRFDMNMPQSLPQRKGSPQSFVDDSPLTVQGLFQAKLLGETMSEKKITFSHVYCSPALRCIQTADSILSGLGISRAIRIEPGIFEWMVWHQTGLPVFMTPEELISAGYNIDISHQPIWNTFDIKETISDYYDRCHKATSTIAERHHNDGSNILLVSHKGSVDVCIRQLTANSKLTLTAFRERVSKVPYCAVSCCLQNPDGKWKLVSPGLPCFTHSANKNYDWKMWL